MTDLEPLLGVDGLLSSEPAQAILRNREELVAQRRHNDLLHVMSTAEGRRFVWDLLDTAGIVAPSYATDPVATAYNEGRRSIGLGLLFRIKEESPEHYATAFTEQLAEQRAEAATRQAALAAPTEKEQ